MSDMNMIITKKNFFYLPKKNFKENKSNLFGFKYYKLSINSESKPGEGFLALKQRLFK